MDFTQIFASRRPRIKPNDKKLVCVRSCVFNKFKMPTVPGISISTLTICIDVYAHNIITELKNNTVATEKHI